MGKRLDKIVLDAKTMANLELLLSKGKQAVRQLKRAQILLQLHKGKQAAVIAEAVGVSLATVYNVHGRYEQERLCKRSLARVSRARSHPRWRQPSRASPAARHQRAAPAGPCRCSTNG